MPSVDASRECRPADVAVGLLMYASTLFFSSNAVLLGVLLLLAGTRKPRLQERPELLLVAGFSVFALLNVALHLPQLDFARHASSPSVLIVTVSAALAPLMRRCSLRVFIVCTCIEALVGCFEYATGSVALTSVQAGLADQDLSLDSELLYDLRVFGLSANSSLLAEKVFISTILTLSVPGLFRRRWLPLALLGAGLYVSFNRTAILCTVLFLLLNALSRRLNWRQVVIGLVVVAGIAGLVVTHWEEVLVQVTRGSGDELSHSELSRLYFWERSLETIAENPLFGNGSLTFRVDDPVTGLPQHAHNSFMMLFATHGVVVPLLLLGYIALRLNKDNWRAVVAFFAFSLTQYFVFWNLSVPDMVLFWLLGQSSHRRQTTPSTAAPPAAAIAASPASRP
jgi:hypothetical protein